MSDAGKEALKDTIYIPACKIKVKLKVKIPSVKNVIEIKPGKTKTIKVKNACKANPVVNASVYPTKENKGGFEVVKVTSTSIKIKASGDGGAARISIYMEKATLEDAFSVYSIQTKKRVYTDVETEGCYDTEVAKKYLSYVNKSREELDKGSSLKEDKFMSAIAAMTARGNGALLPVTLATREAFDTPEELYGNVTGPISDPHERKVGLAVFYDGTKYYLTVITTD